MAHYYRGELSHHPFTRGPARPAPQRFHLRLGDDAAHLDEPHRSEAREHLDDATACGLTAQALDRCEQRLVRLAGPVALDAAAEHDEGAGSMASAHSFERRVDDGRLPDASVSRDEQELLVQRRRRQPALERGHLPVASDGPRDLLRRR